MADWTNAKLADPRKLAEWLEATGRAEQIGFVLGDIGTRIYYRWRHEARHTDIDTVDRMLTGLGIHLSEVPDDVWLDERPPMRCKNGNAHADPATRAAAVAAWHEAGGATNKIAARFDVTPKTIRNWVLAAKEKDQVPA